MSFRAGEMCKTKRVFCSSGDPIAVRYVAEMKDNGEFVLVEAGKENLYEYIQSFAESCDINNIIARFESGETDVLDQVKGFYGDFADLPDNMHEVFNILRRGRDVFDRLPVEEKEKYNNSFEQWIIDFEIPVEKPDEKIVEKIDENGKEGEEK